MTDSAGPVHQWRDGWTSADPADIGFSWAPRDGDDWRAPGPDGLEQRDLGLAEASNGAMGVEMVRVGQDSEPISEWHADDLDFDFLYVLEGGVTLDTEAGETVEFGPGGCAVHRPGAGRRYRDYSDDFRAVRITAPAAYESGVGEDVSFADPGDSRTGAYTHDTDDAYEKGAGPREFFLYRDLGTLEQTEGRVHIHVVAATEPGEGTGWHYHTMAQWFMILRGESTIAVEDHAPQPLVAGDAMCVGRGPRLRHNVAPFSGDYMVLEMCVPAAYETIAVDAPEGALTSQPG